ncbi:MAG: hypothetical protein KY449_01025 [Proteobacteria bacterium]|nr:hypothetical protein [Pseudomonadota bacterium]
MNSWTPYDERTILVRSAGRAFRVTTNRCPRLGDPLARVSRVLPGGSSICSPRDVRLYVSDFGNPNPLPCLVESIELLTPEQAEAMDRTGARQPSTP